MAAYVIANIEVKDPVAYEEYRKGVVATIERFGGRYLARGGAVRALEGTYAPKRVVVLEFPSMGAINAWYGCAEYAPLIAIRQRTSTGDLFAVEGL